MLPAIGAVLGGSLGVGGSLLSSYGQRQAATEMGRDVRYGQGIALAETARQVGTSISSPEYQQYANFIRGMFGMAPQTGAEAFGQMQGTFGDVMYGEGIQGYGKSGKLQYTGNNQPGQPSSGLGHVAGISRAVWNKDFLSSRFGLGPSSTTNLYDVNLGSSGAGYQGAEAGAGNDPFNPLAQQFIKNLGSSQRMRGLYSSQAGASAEASGLAAYKTNLQMQLLPQLQALSTRTMDLANQQMPGNLNYWVSKRTGGVAQYGQATGMQPMNGLQIAGAAVNAGASGALSGASLGISAQQQPQQNRVSQWI